MTHSALASRAEWTDDRSGRDGGRIDRFIVHHAATTSLSGVLSLFRPGGRTVSANYALKDRELVATVPEEYRAWTSGSYIDDRRAVTIEVANSEGGDPWPVSDDSFDTLARLIADVAARYGFDITDDTVLTHQELYTRFGRSYATACPGDLQRRKGELLDLARSYRGQGALPAVTSGGAGGAGLAFDQTVLDQQRWLNAVRGENLEEDGKLGPLTIGAIKRYQTFLRAYGYIGDIDGIWGPQTQAAHQAYGAQRAQGVPAAAPAFPLPDGWYFGPREGPVESVSGYYSYGDDLRRWQQRMAERGWTIDPDGLYGPQTAGVARAFQEEKGLTVDSLIGPETWGAAWTAPIT